jgi:hypothetical protein
MIFEFVIVYQRQVGEVPLHFQLSERINQVLTDNLNEYGFETAERMVRINYIRGEPLAESGTPPPPQRAICGFTLELPDEIASKQSVIDDFIGALQAEPIEHVLKFEDPLLQEDLAKRAKELFSLEMKLRRVISAIYLRAYEDEPHNLLRDETVEPIHKPEEAQMEAAAENEFFFLTFGQYVSLNRRPEVRQIPNLISLIRTKTTYEALLQELERKPVEDEDDSEFLASLKERMNAIEVMRNCVAHNRRPSDKATENYENAFPQVDKALDQFLTRLGYAWQDEMVDNESVEDHEARVAVEWALDNAEWDKESKIITFYSNDDRRIRSTVSSREELERYLCSVAEEEWYAYAPGPSADVAGTYDGDDLVQEVLEPMEERLGRFFKEDDEQQNEPSLERT